MGKSRVKGIVVEIGGDTVGLNKALDGTDKKLYNTQQKLKDVERLLKLDPTNTKLLEQKQRLLGEAISETEERLQSLNTTHDQVVGSVKNYDAWKAVYDPIQEEIDTTKKKLKDLKDQQAKMKDAGEVDTDAYKQLTEEIQNTSSELESLKNRAEEVTDFFGRPISQEQFDGLQREIEETRLNLKNLQDSAEKNLDTIADAVDPVKTKLKALGDAAETVKTKADGVAQTFKPVTTAVAGLATAAAATVPATEELREDLSKLDANAQESAAGVDAARAAWKALAVQSGETDSAVEATSNLLQAGFTESNLQKAVEGLAGAALRFPDTLKVESLADSLQETLATGAATGQFSELLSRLGLDTEAFSENLAACTTEAEKQNLVLQTLADAGLNSSHEAWKANNEEMLANKEANLELQLSMAELAEKVMPVVTTVTNALADFIDWFANLPEPIQGAITGIALFTASISPAASAVSNVSGLLEKLTKVDISKLSEALSDFVTGKGSPILEWLTGTALPGVQTGFETATTFVTTKVDDAVAWLTGTALPAVQAGFETSMSFVTAKIDDTFAWITGTALPALQTGFTSVMSFIAANPVVLLIGAIVGLVALIATKGDEIQALLQKVDDFLQNVFATDWTEIFGPVLGGVLNDFFEIVKGIWDGCKKILDGVIDFIRGVFTGDWERAWNGVVKIFQGIFEGLGTILKAPLNAVIKLINGAIDGINWLINGVNKIPGVSIGTIGHIPLLANGGEVFRGSAIVGEAGPELLTVLGDRTVVQPLTNNTTNNTNHLGGVTMVVYGAPGQDVRELAHIVLDEIQGIYDSKEAALV